MLPAPISQSMGKAIGLCCVMGTDCDIVATRTVFPLLFSNPGNHALNRVPTHRLCFASSPLLCSFVGAVSR